MSPLTLRRKDRLSSSISKKGRLTICARKEQSSTEEKDGLQSDGDL